MFSGLYATYYNWWYYTDKEIDNAKYQVAFFVERISQVQERKDLSQEEKDEKIQRIRQTIECLKYTYSLYNLD